MTKTVSGTVTTYTITDQKGNVMVITATQPPAQNIAIGASGSGLLPDGAQEMATLLQLLSTGLVP